MTGQSEQNGPDEVSAETDPSGAAFDYFEGELGRMLLARSQVDRAAEFRTDAEWQAAAWSDERTRVFAVDDSKAEALLEPAAGLVFRTGAYFDARFPDADRHFLGVDTDGIAYYAVSVGTVVSAASGTEPTASTAGSASTAGAGLQAGSGGGASSAPSAQTASTGDPASATEAALLDAALVEGEHAWLDPANLRHVREIAALLPDRDGGLLAHAVGLDHWHRTHRFCGVCGNLTEPTHSGSVRTCTFCGTEHFPRTDPAVIMAVTDPDDRLLLARNAAWPPNRASVLAGFVEPGETLEAAVARECAEEAGLRISSVRYLGSQPWPLPRSLMLGFEATVADPTLRLDGAELDWAKWYSRAELKEAVSTGELLMLPAEISISRRLINHWYGGDPAADNQWS